MNSDEIKALVPVLVALLAPLGAKYGIGAGDLTAALTGLAGIAGVLYLNWNMKKVPEKSIVVSGSMAAPVVVAAQKVADLPADASPLTINSTKAAAQAAVTAHNP
jgi:hypothetical protein